MLYNSFEIVIIMLILVFMGWGLSHIGWVTDDTKRFLNKFIVNITVPALTLDNFFNSFSRELLVESGKFIVITFGTILILYGISTFIAKSIKIEKIKSGSFIAMCTTSNSMFFGLPIALSIFGDAGVPFVIFFYISNTIMFWGFNAPRIAKDGGFESKGILSNLKNIFNVPLISVIICGILIFMNLRPPSILLNTARYYATLVTPLAAIVVGKVIHEMDFNKLEFHKSIFIVILMRFVVAPLIMFNVAKMFNFTILATQVFTIQSAMPVMIQSTVIAEMYGTDSKYVTSALAITTILSLFFIPLYMFLMT